MSAKTIGTIAIMGIFILSTNYGWAAEETAVGNTEPAISGQEISLVQPATRPHARVKLENIRIVQSRDGRNRLFGEMVVANDSRPLKDISIQVDYSDVAGNILVSEQKKVFESSLWNCQTPLRPGYRRAFEIILDRVPLDYQDVFIGVARVKTSQASELFPLMIEPKLGFGAGWQYGLTGVNLEILMDNTVAITSGLGTSSGFTYGKNPAWTAGIRIYFGDPEYPLRGRFGLLYGTAEVVTDLIQGDVYDIEDSILGFHPSLGMQFRFLQNVSLDLDVAYVIPAQIITKTDTHFWGDYYYYSTANSYTKEDRINLDAAYVSVGAGITFHFGDHSKKFESSKELKYVHVQQE